MEFKMNGDMLNLIDCTARKAVEETVMELKRQNLMNDGRQTPFQKTETLLFNYNNFKAALKDKEEQIREIRENGIRKISKSITSFSGDEGFMSTKTDSEKAEERIAAIEYSIHSTRKFLKVIDEALDGLRDDPYFDLIEMRYLCGYSREEIANEFGCDVKTVTRNKNRLINMLQIRLFSDEVIKQIFEV